MPPAQRRHAYVDVNPYAGAMVKRTRDPMQIALSRVEPRASINPDAASAKHEQAYMYPNGIVKRAPSVMLNGRYYTDPRGDNHRTAHDGDMQRDAQGGNQYPRGVAEGQPRRSIESNFLLTINPNRKWGTDGTGHDPIAQQIFRQTLDTLCENANFLTCLKVPTKTRAQPDYSAHFQNDALHFTDVIVNVDAKGTIEVGEKQKRMHAHMVIEIKHYSMLQLNPPVIRSLFKEIWNEICEQPAYAKYELTAMPYVDVQLLKQNNAMDIIKAYVRKSVGPVSTPDINL